MPHRLAICSQTRKLATGIEGCILYLAISVSYSASSMSMVLEIWIIFQFSVLVKWSFGQVTPDGRTDRQKARHMSPLCISTGVLKNSIVEFPYHFSAGVSSALSLSLSFIARAISRGLQRESWSHPSTWWGEFLDNIFIFPASLGYPLVPAGVPKNSTGFSSALRYRTSVPHRSPGSGGGGGGGFADFSPNSAEDTGLDRQHGKWFVINACPVRGFKVN